MKNFIKALFCLLLLFSCNQKSTENRIKKPQPILIKIGYHPSFHLPAETILNFNEKYLMFYSPSSYSIEPPPPPKKNGGIPSTQEKEYIQYLHERPELKPFNVQLSDHDLERIQRILDSFTAKDFNDKNSEPSIDGMAINIIILYSDGKLAQINPVGTPNEKQKTLYEEVLKLIMEKNTQENNSIILRRIKGYY